MAGTKMTPWTIEECTKLNRFIVEGVPWSEVVLPGRTKASISMKILEMKEHELEKKAQAAFEASDVGKSLQDNASRFAFQELWKDGWKACWKAQDLPYKFGKNSSVAWTKEEDQLLVQVCSGIGIPGRTQESCIDRIRALKRQDRESPA